MQPNAFKFRRLQRAFLAFAIFGAAATLDGDVIALYVSPQAQAQTQPPQIDFDQTLLAVPDGETGAFYLKRLARLEEETKSVGRDFQRARQNCLSSSDASQPLPAPPDSLEAQIFAAVLKTERALIDAADLPSSTRARYFNAYFNDVCQGVRDATKRFALLQELLETEEARESVVLSRVLKLRRTLADAPIADVEPSSDGPSVDAASLEKLLDVPDGESAAFYRDRFAALVAARWQVAGLDDSRSAALPAAYPHWPQTPKYRRDTAVSKIEAAQRKISSFLADAPEIAPAERYYHFQRVVHAPSPNAPTTAKSLGNSAGAGRSKRENSSSGSKSRGFSTSPDGSKTTSSPRSPIRKTRRNKKFAKSCDAPPSSSISLFSTFRKGKAANFIANV